MNKIQKTTGRRPHPSENGSGVGDGNIRFGDKFRATTTLARGAGDGHIFTTAFKDLLSSYPIKFLSVSRWTLAALLKREGNDFYSAHDKRKHILMLARKNNDEFIS